MNQHLQQAYNIGASIAQQTFEKIAREPSDAADVTSAALGGIPLLGPAAAGLASGMTGPVGLRQTTGMATTGGSAVGQALGGLGGAALGAGLGSGGAALYNLLKKRQFDPTLWERITGKKPESVDPAQAAQLGALIGGGAGLLGGGMYGAHAGRGYGEERAEQRDAQREAIRKQIIASMQQAQYPYGQ